MWQFAGLALCAGEYFLGKQVGIDPLTILIPGTRCARAKRDACIDNLLVRIHLIIQIDLGGLVLRHGSLNARANVDEFVPQIHKVNLRIAQSIRAHLTHLAGHLTELVRTSSFLRHS